MPLPLYFPGFPVTGHCKPVEHRRGDPFSLPKKSDFRLLFPGFPIIIILYSTLGGHHYV